MQLFRRIFQRPTPEENLATEILAYFLESFEPFRRRLLTHLGVKNPGGEWVVDTQVQLSAPGERWHKKTTIR